MAMTGTVCVIPGCCCPRLSRRPACCPSGPLGLIVEQYRIVYSIYKGLLNQFDESTLPRLRQRWKASYAHSSQIHGAGYRIFCRSRYRGKRGSAVSHPNRSLPAAKSPNSSSSLCGGGGARRCSTAGGQRLRTATSGRILQGHKCQRKGPVGVRHSGSVFAAIATPAKNAAPGTMDLLRVSI